MGWKLIYKWNRGLVADKKELHSQMARNRKPLKVDMVGIWEVEG